jgi:hypothetical protein
MQLTRTGPTEVTITGNIKSTADYLELRQVVMEIVHLGVAAITLQVRDSLSMPSSVIGFFVKLIRRDQIKVTMVIQDRRLLELLEELDLADLFGARL